MVRDDGGEFLLPILDDLVTTEDTVTSSSVRGNEFQLPTIGELPAVGGKSNMVGSEIGELELPAVGGESDMVQPMAPIIVTSSSVGGNEFQLPTIDELPAVGGKYNMVGSEIGELELPAIGGESDMVQPTGQGDAAGHGEPAAMPPIIRSVFGELELPAVGGGSDIAQPRAQRKRKRFHVVDGITEPSATLWERPYMRTNANNDIPQLAKRYGSDLEELPGFWLETKVASRLVQASHICKGGVFLMEVFAGCANLTRAAQDAGLRVAPSIDILATPAAGGIGSVNLLTASGRQLVWSLLILNSPQWVHVAYPCTFWSEMAHWNRSATPDMNEHTRLEQMVFIRFAQQIQEFQYSRGRYVSVENPPRSRTWELDIVQNMLAAGSMVKTTIDMCQWGSRDPESGLLYKKPMVIASSFDIQCLSRKCHGDEHDHQRIGGRVSSGPMKGYARSALSGKYPPAFCEAWVTRARQCIGV
jgi:hypothetical protein